jgi:hypothetical protein
MPSDADIARAEAFGRLYARRGLSLSKHPLPWDGTAATRVLSYHFGMAYVHAGGMRLTPWARLDGAARRCWYRVKYAVLRMRVRADDQSLASALVEAASVVDFVEGQ